jgi:hypothetical protein
MDLKEQILVALGLNKKEEEVTLAFQAKSDDGTIFVSTAEELENGVDISVLTEDGTTIPVPAGTYKLDTGVSFRVEDEGIVAEVLESETEEEETEEVEAAEDDGKEADVEDWAGLEKRIQNLEDAVADLKRDKEGGDDDVEEMTAEEVSDKPKSIKTTETVEFSAEEELENLKAENEKLKTELAESPADAPINTNKFSSERAAPTKQELKRMTKQEKYLYNLYK